MPYFDKNVESILFLNKNTKNNKYSIYGLTQGKFDIYTDTQNNEVVFRDRFVGHNLQISSVDKNVFLSSDKSIPIERFITSIKNLTSK